VACPWCWSVRGRRDIPCRFVSSGGRGFGVARPGVFVRTWCPSSNRPDRLPTGRGRNGGPPGPPWATVTQPAVTRRAGYGAAPPIADVWSRTARGDEGIPAADHCAPGLDTGQRRSSSLRCGRSTLTAPSPPALCSAIGEMPRCAGMPGLSWPHRGGWVVVMPQPFRDRGGKHPQLPVRGEPDEPTLLGPPMRPTGPGSANSARDPGPAKGNPAAPGPRPPGAAPAWSPHGRFVSGGSDVLVLPGGVLVVLGAGLEAAVQDADEPVRELPQRGVVADLPGPERGVIGPRAG
jgi:hypothetical protein